MTLDTVARNLGSKTIRRYGKRITMIVVTEGIYDTGTSMTINQETPRSAYAVVEDVDRTKFLGNAIDTSDRQITIAALDNPLPSLMDKFVIDGITYTIPVNGIQCIYSGELCALYVVHGKKQ